MIWLGCFYGISTIVGYLIPNTFLYMKSVLFQTIQFNINLQFKQKTVLFQTIQFIISTKFKCQNGSVSNHSI